MGNSASYSATPALEKLEPLFFDGSQAKVVSIHSQTQLVGFRVLNRTRNTVELHWLDWCGNPVCYGRISPGRVM